MTILTPIISVLTILIYFVISIIMPIFGYLVPCYKIKRVNLLDKKSRIMINFSVAGILYILNAKIFILYLIYPIMTEILFYITQKYIFKLKLKTFDRIISMAIISTAIICVLVFYNMNYIDSTLQEALKTSKFNLEPAEIYASFVYLKENMLSVVFSYMLIGNIFLFLSLSPKTYEKWGISCYWLLPFMIIIFLEKVFNISFYGELGENIITMVKFIYTWYGIKTLYKLSEKIGIKFHLIKHLFSISLGIILPIPVFILGALVSFDLVEIKNIVKS